MNNLLLINKKLILIIFFIISLVLIIFFTLGQNPFNKTPLNITKEDALSWSDSKWKENLKKSALKRIKPWMWRRNINSLSDSQ